MCIKTFGVVKNGCMGIPQPVLVTLLDIKILAMAKVFVVPQLYHIIVLEIVSLPNNEHHFYEILFHYHSSCF